MKTLKINFLVAALMVLATSISFSQLTVNNGFNAQQLGNNLAGNNVNIYNATVTGNPLQYGLFNFNGTNLGVNSGVILSTGDIFDAVGPNNSTNTSSNMNGTGDADLTALAGFPTDDAVKLEFDFEVQGDEIEFNFVFLSEEYNEFVNSSFNDVFAFFISGPGIVGMENLAVVPGTTTPVTINTINNGSFWQFYNDNTNGNTNIEFDGFTTLMTASKTGLQPCGIYTLSLRLADGSDNAYDSGVLLQENSLVQSNISASSSTFSANNTALEGCIDASFTFQLDSIMTTDIEIPIGIGGTATNGVDYSQIDSLIVIPAGQLSATLIIDAIADGLLEGQEVIELYFTPSPCAPPDTVFLYIDDYTPLEYNVFPSDVTCNGASNGMVDINVTGGIAPYTLFLTDSITGDETMYTTFPVTGLDVGTYYVEIIDGYGCTAEDIVAGNLFDAGTTFIPDGQGGSYQSSINLSGFGAAQTIQDPNQIQSICATMEHSRIGELLITLTAPNGTQVILKEQPGGAVCNFGEPCAVGPADGGQGNTNTNPGIGYNYCWQNISTYGTMVSEANNYTYSYFNICDSSIQTDKYLPSGSYQPYESFTNFVGVPLNGAWSIEITDMIPNNNGYIFDWSISLQADIPDSVFTITQPDAPIFTNTSVSPDCGVSNGSIDLTVGGGAPPFTFLWSNGATTEDISGLSAGTYSVDITDDSLCTYTYQVNLSNTGLLSLSGITSNETCANADDGSIDLTVTGGVAPVSYLWSNGATTEDLSNLTPGTYTVDVTDGSGCQGLSSFTILSAPNININSSVTNENCGDGEGIIDITVLGAANPVTYVWSNGFTTQDIDELSAGTYSVQLTDANGCTAVDTFTIINLVGNCIPNCDLEITNSQVVNETCGNQNGSINLTTFTSNGPIVYSWNTGSTSEDLSGLSAGTYTINMSDNEGCTVSQSYNIANQTGGLSIASIFTTNEYCGNGQGAANATISGGALPYTFSWSNGATTEDISGVSAGTYTLTVTDANNCSVNSTVTIINDAGTLALTYGNAVDEVCGNSSGSIDIIVAGGQTPYSYQWSNGASTQDLINIPAGSYTCIITDAGGCSITSPTYVVNNQAGSLAFTDIDIDNEVCSNGQGELELFITGGTAPLTFLWNTGATTQNLYSIPAGTYSCIVSDASGCTLSTGNLVVLNESGTLQLNSVTSFDELCGNGTGSISITTSGGTAPLSYLWNNGSTSQNISNLAAGNYSCIITDANGCEVFASATINNDPGSLNVDNIIITNETCGMSNGALDLIVSGAAAPISYLWNNGATTEDLTSISAGNYTVDIIDNNGCSTTGNAVLINDAGNLNITNSQVSNEICSNASGSIDLTITGGAAPLSYLWSNGATTEDISGLSAGTYSCVITDNLGCIINAGPFTVNNSSGGLSLSVNTVTDEICSGNNGAINMNTVGGTAPYTHLWSSGQSTEDITGISAGSYTLTVTDNNGCSNTSTVTIANNAGSLTISSFNINDEVCGNSNGGIDISVTGGTLPYTYSWSNGATAEDLIGVTSGTYSVTVTGQNGCSFTSAPMIVNNSSGNFTLVGINVTNEVCSDGSGNVDLIVSGNSGSVIYNWSNGSTTQDLNNVNAGAYTGTATDANGCVLTFSAVVGNDAGNLAIIDTVNNSTCGGNDGSILLSMSGGTAPYSFLWSNGATSEDIFNLTAGSYTCNITDAGGCSTNYSTTVSTSGIPTFSNINVTDETCGQGNGSITVSMTGGTAPYTYSWSGPPSNPCCTYTLDMQDLGNSWNGASVDVLLDGALEGSYTVFGGGANTGTFTACSGQQIQLSWNQGGFDNEVSFDLIDASGSIIFSQGASPTPGIIYTGTASCTPVPMDGPTVSNLTAGTYTVVVTDQNGCQDSTSIVVNNSSGTLNITSENVQNETCSDINGSIDLSVNGAAPITYLWSNGATTQDLINIAAGTYDVTITDQNGCTITESYSISNITNGLTIIGSVVMNEVCGNGLGSIDITAIGGLGPISYSWSNGSTSEDLSGLSAGAYTVTLNDGSICEYVETFTVINDANGMSHTVSITNESCGSANGAIDLTMTGGATPYTYQWSNGATTEDITGLPAGTYTCSVTDNTGCTYTISETVTNGNGGIAITANVTPEDCGNNDGAVNITVGGGSIPYTYLWSNGATTQDINNLSYGTYTVVVTDAAGCTETATYTVISDGNFNYTANITNELCGNGQGAIDMVYTGFGQPNNFSWSSGQTTADITNLSEGWYVLTMWNNFGPGGGCTMVDSFYVANNQGTLNIDSMLFVNENCGNAGGSIDAYISGGSTPYTYSWNNGATTEDITGLSAGTYTLTVTDNVGCTSSTSQVIQNLTFGFGISSNTIVPENCGNGAGSIDIEVSGGSSPYTYLWSTGQTTQDISSLSAGIYTVTVTDNNGCVTNSSYTVFNQTNGFTVTAVTTDETCGSMNGLIDLTVTGIIAPVTFNWSNGDNTEDADSLTGGTYSCIITNGNGCIITISETIQSFSSNFSLGSPIVVDENCSNGDGSITINPTGGTGYLTYDWTGITPPCCAYTLNMYDLNNNGWGGNPLPQVNVYINGTLYGNFGVPVGNGNDFATESIPVCQGDLIEIGYTESAQNQNNTYEVIDSYGNVVFSDGPNPFNGIAYTATAVCPGGNSNSQTGLSAGNYIVTVTDSIGCMVSDTIAVNVETNGFTIDTAIVTNDACGQVIGSIDIEVSGGYTPYSYAWSNASTNEDQANLNAGSYNVTITDSMGCTLSDTFNVLNITNGFVMDTVIISNDTCNQSIGTIDIQVTGGALPYTYSWSNGATTEDLTDLGVGTYDVTITDNLGCIFTESYSISNVNTSVDYQSVNITNATCASCTDGMIDITMGTGNGPNTFSWSDGSTNEDLSNALPGTYSVTITNAQGCDTTLSFEILNVAGIDELLGFNYSIYPNPNNGLFNLVVNNTSGWEIQMNIFDALGRIIRTQELKQDGTLTIDIHENEAGPYFMEIIVGESKFRERIIIQR